MACRISTRLDTSDIELYRARAAYASCVARVRSGYGVFVYGTSALIVPIREQAPSLSPSIVPYVAGLRSVTFAVTNLFFGERRTS
eukprot:6201565-Pleurochrysis_carterae.AAC.3